MSLSLSNSWGPICPILRTFRIYQWQPSLWRAGQEVLDDDLTAGPCLGAELFRLDADLAPKVLDAKISDKAPPEGLSISGPLKFALSGNTQFEGSPSWRSTSENRFRAPSALSWTFGVDVFITTLF